MAQTSQVPNNWWLYVLLSHEHEGLDHEQGKSANKQALYEMTENMIQLNFSVYM